MDTVKQIKVKVIPATIANAFIKRTHYSGKVVPNSALHFGCYLNGVLHGVMSYGSPISKAKVLPLVQPCKWNEMLELNRMAFDDALGKNAESRCIAVSIRLIKKNAPHIKWILSFADGTQCGDGTIYRASGFKLTGIKKTRDSYLLPKGESYTAITMKLHGYAGSITNYITREKYHEFMGSTANMDKFALLMKHIGAKNNNGHQLRYIYLIDTKASITIPILPFSQIKEMGASMYKGVMRG